jgi:hypothetical protein
MPRISEPSLVRNGADGPHSERAARAEVVLRARALIALATAQADAGTTFIDFEQKLVAEVFVLGRGAANAAIATRRPRRATGAAGRASGGPKSRAATRATRRRTRRWARWSSCTR